MQQGYSTRRSDLYSSSHRSIKSPQNRPLMCRFHPNNDLHTFCLSPQCMLPMCSTCISIHNEDHRQARSHGNYTDLNQFIRETVSIIQQQQSALEELSNEYVEDYSNKKSVSQTCRQNLVRARSKIHEELDRIFDRLALDIQQNVTNFEEQLHQLYNELQNRIHQNYKTLAKQKQDLTKSFQDLTRSTSSNSISITKRPNGQNFTPSQTGLNYETRRGEENQQLKKQDHKILKTLIQIHSHNFCDANRLKINKLKQEASQLKQIDLVIEIDYQKIIKNMKTICGNSIQNKSKANFSQNNRKKGTNKEIKSVQSMESQSNISQNGRNIEMNDVFKNNNERLRRHMHGSRPVDESGHRQQRPTPVKDRQHKVNITYHNHEGM